MPRNSADTRNRILGAADELFYGEGLLNVSLDAIAARAGVTKKTLYYHFRSKDDLIAAYLEARDAPTLNRYQSWASKADGPLARRLREMFASLEHWAGRPKWKGCGFARAAAELDISHNTVRSHVRSIYSKLQVQNVAQAVSRAIREGLV
jgi:AcrR family transcriptional regulator